LTTQNSNFFRKEKKKEKRAEAEAEAEEWGNETKGRVDLLALAQQSHFSSWASQDTFFFGRIL
jgi:hypothetical protein